MTGITKDELMQMARAAGMDAMLGTVRDGKYEPKVNALKSSVPIEWLELLTNAILERAAVECHQGVARMSSDIDGTSFYIATGQCAKAIRALKINTGD